MGLPRAPTLPERVVQRAPNETPPRNTGDELDQAAEATIALLQQAANLSNERCDRAMDLGHQLSLKLRAAEDRIRQLQAERDEFQNRAARAEDWLKRIYHEVEERFISARTGSPRASL
jgi:exonuclease VII small subunit